MPVKLMATPGSNPCVPLLAGLLFLSLALSPAAADPGKIYETRRAAIVARFDKNGDGRLDDTEREAARAARKQQSLHAGFQNPMLQMAPELVEEYDKNKDGQLDEEESRAASEGIRIAWSEAQKQFDTNGDGNLDDAERERMADAVAAGKVKGLPRMFGAMLRRPPGGGMFGGGGGHEASRFEKYDTDKDGRLSEAELAVARKESQKWPAEK